jgi:hypothetical protein
MGIFDDPHAQWDYASRGYAMGCILEDQNLVGEDGNVVELWDLVGVFPTEINFGDLTYEDGSPVEISATLRFDQAILQF